MKNLKRSVLARMFLGVVVILVGSALLDPSGAVGQSAGNNAVYNSSGNCSSCGFSSAFIDASVFGNSSRVPQVSRFSRPGIVGTTDNQTFFAKG
jgi:hypothetical protein